MSSITQSDPLAPLGIAIGAFLVLVGLGTVVGMPWQTNGDLPASIVQLLGVAGTIAIGVGLVWLARQTN